MEPPSEENSYQLVLDDHKALKDQMAKIELTLQERNVSIAEASRVLAQFGDRLVQHFALEEEGGYFAEAMLQAPQLVSQANALMDQHAQLCTKIRNLAVISTSVEDEGRWKEIQNRFAQFLAELRIHERSEDDLLQKAYVDDLGAHD